MVVWTGWRSLVERGRRGTDQCPCQSFMFAPHLSRGSAFLGQSEASHATRCLTLGQVTGLGTWGHL